MERGIAMILFTGDTHGEESRFYQILAAQEKEWTEKDTLIVTGDFQYLFRDDFWEHKFLNELERKRYTICFCCGNHENFDALEGYETETWNGGKVHRIRNNIYHLMRGQFFTIEGKKIFTFGGAHSIDWYMRKEHISWWRQEMPCPQEYAEARENLKRHGYVVDYIVTHTAPTEIIEALGFQPDPDEAELNGFLQEIMRGVKYGEWFFGHWHRDARVDDKHRAIWFDVEKR